MASTVQVKNVAAATTDNEIKDFFSFCGKISDIKVTEEGQTKSAEVTFEKETAMKTALLLNNTQLGANHISVTSATDSTDDGAPFTKGTDDQNSDEISQEEKPRARILAEYLSQGYVVGDATIQRAIELDSKHGVSSRFLQTLQGLDQKYHATDRARATDQNYSITQRASNFLSGFASYFEKATNTPTGQKIAKFYEDGSKQVQEVHAEARRLAELKKEEHGGSAYKASGMEKIFGQEKSTESTTATGTTPSDAVPLMTPSNVQDAGPVPNVQPQATDEKTGH